MNTALIAGFKNGEPFNPVKSKAASSVKGRGSKGEGFSGLLDKVRQRSTPAGNEPSDKLNEKPDVSNAKPEASNQKSEALNRNTGKEKAEFSDDKPESVKEQTVDGNNAPKDLESDTDNTREVLRQLAEIITALGILPDQMQKGQENVTGYQFASGQDVQLMGNLAGTDQLNSRLGELAELLGRLMDSSEFEGKNDPSLQRLVQVFKEQAGDVKSLPDAEFLGRLIDTLKRNQPGSATGLAVTKETTDSKGATETAFNQQLVDTGPYLKTGTNQKDHAAITAATDTEVSGADSLLQNLRAAREEPNGGTLRSGQSQDGQAQDAQSLQNPSKFETKESFGRRFSPGVTVEGNIGPNQLNPEAFVKANPNQGFEILQGIEQPSQLTKTNTIFSQIAQKAKLVIAPGITEMQIQLKPEVLGKLNLNITSENGMVTARFNAESHTVKAIIEANLNSLKDALNQQGVKVDQILVDVEAHSQPGFDRRNSYYQKNANAGKGSNAVNAGDIDSLFGNDAYSGTLKAYYGNTVEFTA